VRQVGYLQELCCSLVKQPLHNYNQLNKQI